MEKSIFTIGKYRKNILLYNIYISFIYLLIMLQVCTLLPHKEEVGSSHHRLRKNEQLRYPITERQRQVNLVYQQLQQERTISIRGVRRFGMCFGKEKKPKIINTEYLVSLITWLVYLTIPYPRIILAVAPIAFHG